MPGFSIGGSRNGPLHRVRGAADEVRRRQWLSIQRAALLTERELKKGIRDGAPGGKRFRPLARSTLLLRKGSKPLIDTGALLGSISISTNPATMTAFIGVFRKARNGAFNVAIAHEFGSKSFVISVTPAMRRLFWYLHRASGGQIKPISPNRTMIVHPGIPERPFVRPTIEKVKPMVKVAIETTLFEKGGPI